MPAARGIADKPLAPGTAEPVSFDIKTEDPLRKGLEKLGESRSSRSA